MKSLSVDELLLAGYILHKQKKAAAIVRRNYMREYYAKRKLNGFIKTKIKPRAILRLEREFGDFIVSFN
jgi:hypothetical protein